MYRSKVTESKEKLIEFMRDVVQNIGGLDVTSIISETGINYGTVYKYMKNGGESLEMTLYYVQKTYEILSNRDFIASAAEMVVEDLRQDFMECYSVEHFQEILYNV